MSVGIYLPKVVPEAQAVPFQDPIIKHRAEEQARLRREANPQPVDMSLEQRPCFVCQAPAAVPKSTPANVQAWCSVACKTKYQQGYDQRQAAFAQFTATNKELFYDCDHNVKLIRAMLEKWNQPFTPKSIEAAFLNLLASGQMLRKLTIQEVQNMSANAYARRMNLDPGMG